MGNQNEAFVAVFRKCHEFIGQIKKLKYSERQNVFYLIE